MSSALTVRVASPQPVSTTSASTGTRGLARRDSDGPSGGASGFDAVLTSHAAPPKPPQTKVKAAPGDFRPGVGSRGRTQASDRQAKAAAALKRDRADAARRDDAVPTSADAQEGAAAADRAERVAGKTPTTSPAADGDAAQTAADAAAATAATAAGEPSESASGVVVPPALSTVVPPTASLTASGLPALASGDAGVGTSAVGSTSAVDAKTAADAKSAVDASAAPTSGEASAASDQTGPDATGSTASLPGQPVGSATAGVSSNHHQSAAASGAPTTPVVGVAPALAAPVPSAAAWPSSVTSATGLPASVSLPAAHQQVLTAVTPLLRGADGSYGVHLQLHPEDLGAVQLTVDVRHGEISIQMHSTDPDARDALRSGLADLRQQLEDQGLRAGSMDVGSGGPNAQQPEMSWARREAIHVPSRGLAPSDPLVVGAVPASSTALDLRM